MPYLVGKIDLRGGSVDVTDPCYDKDVWCRITTKVLPGMYNCYAGIDRNGRCYSCGIVHEDYDDDDLDILFEDGEWAYIGVDSGHAGFFADKPDFSQKEWMKVCDGMFKEERFKTKYKNAYLCKKEDWFEGFFTESGIGDGEYPIFIAVTEGKWDEGGEIVAMEIDFR